MSEYNIDKATGVSQEINQVPPPKNPQYLTAFLVGLVVSFVVAIALAAIDIWHEFEWLLVLITGAILVRIIHNFLPTKSIGGAIIVAILCSATFFMYQIFDPMIGLFYEDGGSTSWWFLVVAFVYGAYAYMRYNNDND